MPEPPSAPLVEALCDASRYDHPVGDVSLIETHVSWVILTGPYAYKIKKPVRLDFVDCSTLARRRHFCHEELRLNRRLAPDLYLEVVPIYGSHRAPTFDAAGEPIEYAVKMRQFPQEQLLSRVIARGELTAAHIDDLVGQVSAFHGSIGRATADSPFATPQVIDRQARENFPSLLKAAKNTAWEARVLALQAWFVQAATDLREAFVGRKQQGAVRECHGDMHLGNMILQEGSVVIFDGIDFNEELRWIDVAAEVAFLTMDLEDRGAPELAHRFINGYLEQTGDYGMLEVMPFYLAYRALVRAKVIAIRLQQDHLNAEERKGLQEDVRGYLVLAENYIQPPHPRLLITHGPSGSGKSYVTQHLLERSGAIRVRSDVERKRLFGLAPLERSDDHPELDLYTEEASKRTYGRLLRLAERILRSGFTALVDAVFSAPGERSAFQQLATDLGVPYAILEFRASRDILREQVRARDRQGRDASEADLSVLDRQLASWTPLSPTEKEVAVLIEAGKEEDWASVWERILRHGA